MRHAQLTMNVRSALGGGNNAALRSILPCNLLADLRAHRRTAFVLRPPRSDARPRAAVLSLRAGPLRCSPRPAHRGAPRAGAGGLARHRPQGQGGVCCWCRRLGGLRLGDREGAVGGGCDGGGGHVAARPRDLREVAQVGEARRRPHPLGRLEDGGAEDLPARRRLRRAGRRAGRREEQQAVRGAGWVHDLRGGGQGAGRLRQGGRARPLARQRPRGEAAADAGVAQRLPRGGERVVVLDGEPGAEVHAVHEQGRLDPLALVRRRRACRARLRWRDVVGEGAAGVGHEGARV